jgi:AraC-like DNA-binding protein
MSIYTTPLQFGYFLALLFAVLFWVRGMREERLSDTLLGWLMLLLNQSIQDYTFGFAGINFLWEELNGYPRGVGLLIGPALYFYLRSQTNRSFKLKRRHLLHLIPWLLFYVLRLQFFLRGADAVQAFQQSQAGEIVDVCGTLVLWASLGFYFTKSIQLYKRYQSWIATAYSDLETVNLHWFRNFIYVFILGYAFQQAMMSADYFADWNFYQDWWWNLALVVIVIYVALKGYAQPQMVPFTFDESAIEKELKPKKEIDEAVKQGLTAAMENAQLYLEPELTLASLAKRLNSTPAVVSATINQAFGRNFNEFVNGYRIAKFKREVGQPENKNLTLLGVAFDCGFNSKATFNRVFKKMEGISPKEFLDKISAN